VQVLHVEFAVGHGPRVDLGFLLTIDLVLADGLLLLLVLVLRLDFLGTIVEFTLFSGSRK
jgi:hypothetical protein